MFKWLFDKTFYIVEFDEIELSC